MSYRVSVTSPLPTYGLGKLPGSSSREGITTYSSDYTRYRPPSGRRSSGTSYSPSTNRPTGTGGRPLPNGRGPLDSSGRKLSSYSIDSRHTSSLRSVPVRSNASFGTSLTSDRDFKSSTIIGTLPRKYSPSSSSYKETVNRYQRSKSVANLDRVNSDLSNMKLNGYESVKPSPRLELEDDVFSRTSRKDRYNYEKANEDNVRTGSRVSRVSSNSDNKAVGNDDIFSPRDRENLGRGSSLSRDVIFNRRDSSSDLQQSKHLSRQNSNSSISNEGDHPKNMSLWGRIQQLPQEALTQIRSVYRGFPIEVRHYLAEWLEKQPWKELDENNPAHEVFARQLLSRLIELLEERAGSSAEFINRFTIQNYAAQFKETYNNHPLLLVRNVKQCLLMEEEIVRMAEMQMGIDSGVTDSIQNPGVTVLMQEIQGKLDEYARHTEHTDVFLKDMQRVQENFVVDYQNQLRLTAKINQMKEQKPVNTEVINQLNQLQGEKDNMDKELLNAAHKILQQRIELAGKHKMTLGGLESLQKKVVEEELLRWKRNQQLAGNGASFDATHIELIQKWCESLVELVWKNRQQIIQVDLLIQQLPIDVPQGITDVQPELNQIATGLLSSLVTSTFIVEQQPPQVLKKDSRFTATVRLLVGGKLNLQMSPPRVKATIISEQQARGLLQNDEGRRKQQSGDILNDNGTMDYHQHTGVLSITFRNMALKNIRRAERRGAEVHTVAEEKFCILFSSDFDVGGNELKFQVWTLSLPVVVTVHGNQECQATATYLWDNQFSEPGRVPFVVPDTVPWAEVGKMLSVKFRSMTGCGLSESNLRYLFHKLYGSAEVPENQDLSTVVVTWSQFNKENLPGRNFTFWEWFWSVAKLVKEHLKAQWNDQLIIGFMDKNESQDKLLSKPNGTFLLRFSDGTVGGITIAWVADHPEKIGERQVWNLAPWAIKDFQIRGLADRVKDLPSLTMLYPDIPKDRAFSKYYSPPTEPPPDVTNGGYVKTTLINIIDQMHGAAVANLDNPQTPQAFTGPGSPSIGQPTTPSVIDAHMDGDQDLHGMLMSPQDYGHELTLNEWFSANLTNSA